MKQLKLTFLLTMLISMAGVKVVAQDGNYDVEVDGIYYSFVSEGVMVVNPTLTEDGDGVHASSLNYSGGINIPESIAYDYQVYQVKAIGPFAFWGCDKLTSVNLPETIISIGSYSFSGCTSLHSVTIPISVVSIDEGAFSDCGSISMIVGWNDPPSIFEGNIFGGDGFGSTLYVPAGSKAAYEADYYWSRFQEIVELIYFSDRNVKNVCVSNWDTNGDGELNEDEAASVTSLGQAFKNNSNIKSFDELRYFTGLTNIMNNEFYNCTKLSSIVIPRNITSIGNYAFFNCGITSLVIPCNVTSIGRGAFLDCGLGLTSIVVENENPKYDSRDNCNAIIESETNTLILGCNATTIPNSVTKISDSAFSHCLTLSSVTIPSGVTSIGAWAFYNCASLKAVEIPDLVTSIGEDAFWHCDALTSVIIGESVTNIGNTAFQDCDRLISVTVKKKSPVSITANVFTNRTNATLYVPYGCKAAYEAADYWKDFKEIVEIGAQNFILEINGHFNPSQSHLYDRDGKEYDVLDFAYNEFDEGSYIRIEPFVAAALYIKEIIVNGESVGTWMEDNAPTEYVIESLSENTTVEFKTYLRTQWRTLGCIAEGPGKVEMYKNGNLIGTASSPENYFSNVFECGDVIKLVIVPDAGRTLTQFLGGEYSTDEALSENLLGEITDNAYSFTFNPDDIVNKYGYLVRFFKAIFEGPEPSTNNALSATVPTLLTGKTSTMSLSLTNEDVIIACEFDLLLPNGITLAKDEDGDVIREKGSRASKHVLEVSDRGNGVYHFLCYSNTNEAFTGNEGELLSVEFVCDESISEGTYEATVKNIILSDPDLKKLTLADYTFGVEVIDADPGDVNNDGDINVMDVVQTVAYIMGNGTTDFIFGAADMDNDGSINVVDLVRIVSMIMTSSTTAPAQPWTDNSLLLNTRADGTIAVGVDTDRPYVASEFIVEVGSGQSLEDVSTDKQHRATFVSVDDTHYKVMTYSSSNQQFADTEAMLTLHVSGEGMVTVRDAMLVDEDYKGVTFAPTSGGYTTGIMQMENGKLIIENSSVYDLQGRKHDTLQSFKHEVLIVNGKKQVVK